MVVVGTDPLDTNALARASVEFGVFVVAVSHLEPAGAVILGVPLVSPKELTRWALRRINARLQVASYDDNSMLSLRHHEVVFYVGVRRN